MLLINAEEGIRLGVAYNPNTPPETLARLADDEDEWVRRLVANNPSTPPETLARLADDEDRAVRYGVAKNPNTPQYIKDYLNAVKFMGECYGS